MNTPVIPNILQVVGVLHQQLPTAFPIPIGSLGALPRADILPPLQGSWERTQRNTSPYIFPYTSIPLYLIPLPQISTFAFCLLLARRSSNLHHYACHGLCQPVSCKPSSAGGPMPTANCLLFHASNSPAITFKLLMTSIASEILLPRIISA